MFLKEVEAVSGRSAVIAGDEKAMTAFHPLRP